MGRTAARVAAAAALVSVAAGCAQWTNPGNTTTAGSACDIPVTGIPWSDSREPPTYAARLAGGDWTCWAMTLPGGNSWNYLSVQMDREDAESDPDLYGKYYEPGTEQTTRPERSTVGWDFSEISSSSVNTVSIREARADLPADKTYAGVWLCVYAYGRHESNFTVRPMVSTCPRDFSADPAAATLECSTEYRGSGEPHGTCSVDGHCQCEAAYATPAGVEPYDDLGFDRCAAKVTTVPSGDRQWKETDQTLKSDYWSFFKFNVTDEDYEVTVSLAREGEDGGRPELYVKQGQPPSSGWREYDVRPKTTWYGEEEEEHSVTISNGDEYFKTGTWYAGVHAANHEAAKFAVELARHDCPNDCNGHGDPAFGPNRNGCVVLANQTRVCRCLPGYFKDDCSGEFIEPEKKSNVWSITGKLSSSHYHFFKMPTIDIAQAKRHVELELNLGYGISKQSYYWVSSRPLLLLLQSETMGAGDYPSTEHYTTKYTLENEGATFSTSICPSQLTSGHWSAAIYNPVSIEEITYNLTFVKTALCPSASATDPCSGHGTCCDEHSISNDLRCTESNYGMCMCDGDFQGADCTVNTKALIERCEPGSFSRTTQPGGKVCLRKCVDGSYQGCHDCDADEWYTDPSGWSCKLQCGSPGGGADDTLMGCITGTLMCQTPLVPVPGDRLGCYNPGCSKGAEVLVDESPEHGVCHATCECDPALEEFSFAGLPGGRPRVDRTPVCKATLKDGKCTKLYCSSGYDVVEEADGIQQCARVLHGGGGGGTSGGVVAFIAFLMLAIGAGLGVGGYLYYQLRKAGGAGGFNMAYSDFSDM